MKKEQSTKNISIIITAIALCVAFPVLWFIAFAVVGYMIYKKHVTPHASATPNKPRKAASTPYVEHKYTTDSPEHIAHPDNHISDYSGLDPYLQEDIRKHNKRYRGMSDLLQ